MQVNLVWLGMKLLKAKCPPVHPLGSAGFTPNRFALLSDVSVGITGAQYAIQYFLSLKGCAWSEQSLVMEEGKKRNISNNADLKLGTETTFLLHIGEPEVLVCPNLSNYY